MSSLVLLVAVLLVLVVALVVGVLVYLTHRQPVWAVPLTTGLVGATLLAAVVVPIVVR
ncbi:hypothetical protein ACN24M_39490 [Streptomyces microflavus]|uniref:hypothetical protein n=1 Tax=Streptomyces microflavus TaxID=1919 RepID=UPI003B20D17D